MMIARVLNASQVAKMKEVVDSCPYHEIYGVEAVGLNTHNYTFQIKIFVHV